MSDRRQDPPRRTPVRGSGAIPRVSGEYRIIVPRSAGRELDELDIDIIADGDGLELELECMPSSHRLRVATPPPMLPQALALREHSEVRLAAVRPAPGRPQSSPQHTIDPHTAIVAFAGFGDPPATVWGTPAYAMRVIERRRVLRAALFRARSLRSQDVGLYEAALEAADGPAVRKGIVIVVLTVAIAFAICAQLITDAVPLPW